MQLTVTPHLPTDANVALALHGCPAEAGAGAVDVHLRVVPGTVVGSLRARGDGRTRPADSGDPLAALPARLRLRAAEAAPAGREPPPARLGRRLADAPESWAFEPVALHAPLAPTPFPGAEVTLTAASADLLQWGRSPLSVPVVADFRGRALAHALRDVQIFTRDAAGGWQARPPAGIAASAGLSYLGRVIQAEVGGRLLLTRRQGLPGEAPPPIGEQTLYVFGDAHQIPADDAPSGVRLTALPPDTTLHFLGPTGAPLGGSLAEAVASPRCYATRSNPGRDGSAGAVTENLRFFTPPSGGLDLFHPLHATSAGDLAFVAGDHPHATLLTVRPGQTLTLSAMFQELRAAGLNFPRIVLVSARTVPGGHAAAYDLAANLSLSGVPR